MSRWPETKPLGALYFGKGNSKSFAVRLLKAKRLALLKRRHRVWVRRQDTDHEPGPSEDGGVGSGFDDLFD